MAITGVFPAVARDPIRLADAAGRQHDGLGVKDFEPATIPVERKSADHAVAILEQFDHGALHVVVNSLMYGVVLQRANHLQACAVPNVCEPRIGVATEVPLQDAPVGRAVE